MYRIISVDLAQRCRAISTTKTAWAARVLHIVSSAFRRIDIFSCSNVPRIQLRCRSCKHRNKFRVATIIGN
jgi:hypothetical protein